MNNQSPKTGSRRVENFAPARIGSKRAAAAYVAEAPEDIKMGKQINLLTAGGLSD